MRVRMFKRGPLAPGAEGPPRWVPHGTYSGAMDSCLEWLPRADGGGGTSGREYLLIEQDGHDGQITKVVTIRLVAPKPRLNVEFI